MSIKMLENRLSDQIGAGGHVCFKYQAPVSWSGSLILHTRENKLVIAMNVLMTALRAVMTSAMSCPVYCRGASKTLGRLCAFKVETNGLC